MTPARQLPRTVKRRQLHVFDDSIAAQIARMRIDQATQSRNPYVTQEWRDRRVAWIEQEIQRLERLR